MERKQNKSSTEALTFSQLELANLQARGIDESDIHDGVRKWMDEVMDKAMAYKLGGKTGKKQNLYTRTKNSFWSSQHSGRVIREALQDAIEKKIGSKTTLEKARLKFDEVKDYTATNVQGILRLCAYDDAVKPSGEYDFLITLADFAMSINIEVKKQLNLDTQSKQNLNDSLKSAAKQSADHAKYHSQMFGRMVSDQQFIKVACVIPGKLDRAKICPHCSSLIITGDTKEEIQDQLHKLCARLTKTRNPILNEKKSHQDFLTLFEATLGFSHISVKKSLTSFAWNQIQGTGKDILDLSAGWTKADTDLLPEDIVFQNVIERPHDFYKSIYWNKEQLVVLLNHCPYVIFAADYSAGKFIEYFSFHKFKSH